MSIVNPYRFGGAGGGDLADIKTNLVSWWDHDTDHVDEHGSYDADGDIGSPTYGDPASFDSSNHPWWLSSTSFPADLDAADDVTYLAMGETNTLDGLNFFLRGQQSRHLAAIDSLGRLQAKIYTVSAPISAADYAADTAYLIGVQSEDQGGGNIIVSSILDGSIIQSSASSAKGADDTYYRHGNAVNTGGVEIYWAACWTRLLTATELTALVDETLTYSDLP